MKYPTINCVDRADEGVPRLPDFLIIGEMKCGTTTLWEVLDRHPRVAFPCEKELHYFNRRMGEGRDWYASWFGTANPNQICGEATPDYLFCDGACERIRNEIPEAKFVVILRDPTNRAWSHYWHNVRRGRELLTFEEALEEESVRLQSDDSVTRAHFAYVTRGHYIRRLNEFAKIFGSDRLCVVFLEDLIMDPRSVTLEVCRHLGIDGDEPLHVGNPPRRNRADYPRWPRVSLITSRLMRSVRNNQLIGGPAALLARATRPLRTYSGRSCMEPELEREIRLGFSESDAELADWLGRRVPWRHS